MKNLSIAILALLTVLLCACSGLDTESAISQAESDLQSGNYQLAASECDMLTDTAATTLTSGQLCRVAIIYAKISEGSDDHNYMVAATQCLDKAMAMDAGVDTLAHFMEQLDIESQNVLSSIRDVSQALKTPQEIEEEDFEDPDLETLAESTSPNPTL